MECENWAFASAWASDEARSHGCERTKVRPSLVSTGHSLEQSSSWKRHCCMDSRYIPTAAASSWMLFFTHSVLDWGILIGRFFLCRQENYLLHHICPRNKHLDLYTMTCMTLLSLISLQLFLFTASKVQKWLRRLPRWEKKKKTKKPGRWGRSRGGGSGDK